MVYIVNVLSHVGLWLPPFHQEDTSIQLKTQPHHTWGGGALGQRRHIQSGS